VYSSGSPVKRIITSNYQYTGKGREVFRFLYDELKKVFLLSSARIKIKFKRSS